MAYTTKAKVDALFGTNIDNTLFTSLLASVKAFIDRYCGKTFEGVSETRYYTPLKGSNCLLVDSFTGNPTVTILNQDGTTDRVLTQGQASDFITAPYNSTEKNQLELTGLGWYTHWPCWKHSVQVVATFGGSAAVPSDIELVATQLVGRLAADGVSNGKKAEALGDYSVSYGEVQDSATEMSVTTILDSYRDIDI